MSKTKKQNSKEVKNNSKQVTKTSENCKTKKILKRIFDIVFWVGISLLAIIWLTDFFRMKNDYEPIFCLSEKTHKFDDGTVYECRGIGYNIYYYNRDSMKNAQQFSPFFIGMKK